MSEAYKGNNNEDEFRAIVEGLELQDVDEHSIEDDDIPLEAKLASDRVEALPKIDFNDITHNWLEIQGGIRRYVLYGLGRTSLGVVCELTHHENGNTEYVLVQGSFAIEGVLAEDEALTYAYSMSEAEEPDEDTKQIAVAIKNEEGEVCSVVVFNRNAVQRDSYVKMRPVYSLEDFTELAQEQQSFENPQPFYTVALDMPSGDKKLFVVDVSSVSMEKVFRARLFRESDAGVISAFGRVDAPEWKQFVIPDSTSSDLD